jgi:hypothetical protein
MTRVYIPDDSPPGAYITSAEVLGLMTTTQTGVLTSVVDNNGSPWFMLACALKTSRSLFNLILFNDFELREIEEIHEERNFNGQYVLKERLTSARERDLVFVREVVERWLETR